MKIKKKPKDFIYNIFLKKTSNNVKKKFNIESIILLGNTYQLN